MFIQWIVGILKAINSNQKPSEIGAAVALGLMLALVPSNNLFWVILFLITFFLRVHFGTELIFIAIFKLIAPLFDGLLHPLGYAVLTIPGLEHFYTALYNTPFVPFTKFNNTIVMGGFLAGLILFIPVTILFTYLLKLYRNKFKTAVENSKLVKGFMNLPIIGTLVKAAGKASSIYSRTH